MDQGCCAPPVVPNIIQGEDRTLTFYLTNDSTGFPLDISSASQITATFLNADNTYLTLHLTGMPGGIAILSGPGGAFTATLSAVQTALLAIGTGDGFANVTLSYTIGGSTRKLNVVNMFMVTAPVN